MSLSANFLPNYPKVSIITTRFFHRWFVRPPSDEQLRHMIKGVIYLLPMKHVLDKQLSSEYCRATEAYLSCVRDVEDHAFSEGAFGGASSQSFRPPDDFDERLEKRKEEWREKEARELRPVVSQYIRLVKVDGFRYDDAGL